MPPGRDPQGLEATTTAVLLVATPRSLGVGASDEGASAPYSRCSLPGPIAPGACLGKWQTVGAAIEHVLRQPFLWLIRLSSELRMSPLSIRGLAAPVPRSRSDNGEAMLSQFPRKPGVGRPRLAGESGTTQRSRAVGGAKRG